MLERVWAVVNRFADMCKSSYDARRRDVLVMLLVSRNAITRSTLALSLVRSYRKCVCRRTIAQALLTSEKLKLQLSEIAYVALMKNLPSRLDEHAPAFPPRKLTPFARFLQLRNDVDLLQSSRSLQGSLSSNGTRRVVVKTSATKVAKLLESKSKAIRAFESSRRTVQLLQRVGLSLDAYLTLHHETLHDELFRFEFEKMKARVMDKVTALIYVNVRDFFFCAVVKQLKLLFAILQYLQSQPGSNTQAMVKRLTARRRKLENFLRSQYMVMCEWKKRKGDVVDDVLDFKRLTDGDYRQLEHGVGGSQPDAYMNVTRLSNRVRALSEEIIDIELSAPKVIDFFRKNVIRLDECRLDLDRFLKESIPLPSVERSVWAYDYELYRQRACMAGLYREASENLSGLLQATGSGHEIEGCVSAHPHVRTAIIDPVIDTQSLAATYLDDDERDSTGNNSGSDSESDVVDELELWSDEDD
jgi:hypothetical protein